MKAARQEALSFSVGVEDLVAIAEASTLTPETRAELMDVARRMRAAADAIDRITKVKAKKNVDEMGEPTFRFATKVTIPDDFKLTLRLTKYALDAGFDLMAQAKMLEDFVTFYRKGGRKWQDWSRVWMDWVRREKERLATAPKTRTTSGALPRW